ncbi:DUF1919 domain-containing protein [Campylobacter lari]|nr:DUF1919 domain-containing protein [Campylobacter lari]
MISIFSNNCIAGFLYNDYNIKFYSPTINLQFTPMDFIKFCSNIDFYLSIKLEENQDMQIAEEQFALISNVKINKQFPVGKLGDILVFFQHYRSFKEAADKWEDRKKRVTRNNIYIILNYFNYDHFKCHVYFDLICESFKNLNFCNKIFIHSIKDRIDLQDKEFVYIPKIETPWYSHVSYNKNNIKVYQIYNFDKWFFNCNALNVKTQELTSKTIQLQESKQLITNQTTQIQNLNNTLNKTIKEKDLVINSGINQINQLQNNMQEKITQLNQLQFRLSFQSQHGTAKTRIQNQLSYKLGQAMIINSKSFLGYIRMPFVLSYIKDKHKQEQKIYQEKIKKDPSLKLPPLENYPDYKEALKLKNHLSYKLGQALIKANKTWYRGGDQVAI